MEALKARVWLFPVWLWLAAGAAAVAVVAAFVFSGIVQRDREQRFLAHLDANVTTTVGDLPDEQLLVSMRLNCEKIADGWTASDNMIPAMRTWGAGMVGISKTEYFANVAALWSAAESVCK